LPTALLEHAKSLRSLWHAQAKLWATGYAVVSFKKNHQNKLEFELKNAIELRCKFKNKKVNWRIKARSVASFLASNASR